MGTDRENRIEQKNSLLCPFCKASVIRYGTPQIVMQFLIDVDQGRRDLDARLHGETQPMRLPGFMVWILPENDDLDLAQRSEMKCVQDIPRGRLHLEHRIFSFYFFIQFRVIGLAEFC